MILRAIPLDFITMLAPPTRIDCGCSTTQAWEEGARHVDYRRRLSPELSADCFYGSGNWGVRRTAIESQRWRSRAFYRELKQRGISVRVGMEATGYSRWFERLRAAT